MVELLLSSLQLTPMSNYLYTHSIHKTKKVALALASNYKHLVDATIKKLKHKMVYELKKVMIYELKT